MFEELLRASAFRVVTFQEFTNTEIDARVNDWLQKQSADTVVYNMMASHTLASPGASFTMTIAYGNRPRSSGT